MGYKNLYLKDGQDSMDWINLAYDRDRCRALVNVVKSPHIHQMQGI
jgi:hypothetical protein